VRDPLRESQPRRGPTVLLIAAALAAVGGTAFLMLAGRIDPELVPDEVLQAELGLKERDRVFSVVLTGGEQERPDPGEVVIEGDAFVQFVSGDWLVHEVVFEVDSLAPDARAFLESTDQVDSPPLLRQDSRFVVDFTDAPRGRYPYLLEGNGAPGRGVVVLVDKP